MSRKLDFHCKYCGKKVKTTADFAAGEEKKKDHENKCKNNPKFKNK